MQKERQNPVPSPEWAALVQAEMARIEALVVSK